MKEPNSSDIQQLLTTNTSTNGLVRDGSLARNVYTQMKEIVEHCRLETTTDHLGSVSRVYRVHFLSTKLLYSPLVSRKPKTVLLSIDRFSKPQQTPSWLVQLLIVMT